MRIGSIVRAGLAMTAAGSLCFSGGMLVWSQEPTSQPTIAFGDESDEVALQTDSTLDERLRSYRVELSTDGFLPGRINVIDSQTGSIIPADDMTIEFLRDGEVAATTKPGVDGVFQVGNLQPGVYAVVGAGPAGYIAYGVEVIQNRKTADADRPGPRLGGDANQVGLFQEVGDALMLDSLAVPASDVPAVAGIVRGNIPSSLTATASGQLSPEAAPGAQLPAEPRREQLATSSDLRRHQVRIRADGSISGRMRRIHPRTGEPVRIRRLNVFLVQNNAIVGRAPVDERGVFRIANVQPGTYSFVSAGLEGFAAFAIQAVSDSLANADVPDELLMPVAFTQVNPAQEFEELKDLFATTVSPENMPAAVERLNNLLQQLGLGDLGDFGFDPNTGAPGGGGTGGSSGSSGGGGGGGEGGGLAGALLGGALGAAIGAALADDDDDSPTIVSPFNPGN